MNARKPIAGYLLLQLALCWHPVAAQPTSGAMVESYDALVENVLALRRLESGFVGALLDGHRRAAEDLMRREEFERAAAEMTRFANEGDDAIAGIRQRLIEAGHRYHADADRQSRYEPGFVIVTREARQSILAAAAALVEASTDEQRQKAWSDFAITAEALMMAD